MKAFCCGAPPCCGSHCNRSLFPVALRIQLRALAGLASQVAFGHPWPPVVLWKQGSSVRPCRYCRYRSRSPRPVLEGLEKAGHRTTAKNSCVRRVCSVFCFVLIVLFPSRRATTDADRGGRICRADPPHWTEPFGTRSGRIPGVRSSGVRKAGYGSTENRIVLKCLSNVKARLSPSLFMIANETQSATEKSCSVYFRIVS